MSDPRRPDDPSSIADAAGLFDTSEIRTLNPEPAAAPAPPPVAADDEYGLELPAAGAAPAAPVPPIPAARPKTPRAAEADPAEPLPPRVAPRAARKRPEPDDDVADTVTDMDVPVRPAPKPKRRPSEQAFAIDETDEREAVATADDADEVDPVWTRAAEWGPDLFRVGLVAFATLVTAYFTLRVSFGLSFLVFALGMAAAVLLSYPMAVTIERPVRITPEQAVKDFYAAASHHFPHYRRMWLLLSPAARAAGRFDSFGAFRSAWARRVEEWREGKGKFTPLYFKVGDFRGDKSVGQTVADVAYTVQVYVRDQEDKPLASYKMAHGVVRGPDRMWYLDQGTLGNAR